jgi:hypothetical protein
MLHMLHLDAMYVRMRMRVRMGVHSLHVCMSVLHVLSHSVVRRGPIGSVA